MPFSIKVDQKHHLVIAKVWGIYDPNVFEEEAAALDGMGPFDDDYRWLKLFHEHVQISIPAGKLRSVAYQRSEGLRSKQLPFHPNAKRVIMAPADVAYGLSRLYGSESNRADIQFAVVRTITEAAAEFGMDVADIDMTFPV